MSKSDQPLSSFGAELHSTLRAGADRELRIKFPSVRMATRFHQRINQLRLAMKKSGHPDWPQLYRCGLHFAEDDPTTLIIGPKDSEFRSILRDAGVAGIDSPAPVSEVVVPEPSLDPADTFLSTLVEETTIPKDIK
jgi:hypothetical protein